MRNSAFHHKTLFLCESCFTLRNFAFAPKTFVPHKFCNPPINSFYSQIFRVSLTTLLYPWDTVHSQKNWFPQETLRNLVFSQLLHFPPQEICVHFCVSWKMFHQQVLRDPKKLYIYLQSFHIFPKKHCIYSQKLWHRTSEHKYIFLHHVPLGPPVLIRLYFHTMIGAVCN